MWIKEYSSLTLGFKNIIGKQKHPIALFLIENSAAWHGTLVEICVTSTNYKSVSRTRTEKV